MLMISCRIHAAQAYNFKLNEPWVSHMLKTQVDNIFLEDMAILKAQQQNMDFGPSPAVGLGQNYITGRPFGPL